MPGRLFTAMVLASACAVAAAAAELESPASRVTLLELYTSEGCSSCPPADRWLRELDGDERLWRDVVPVAFHVDYWDYIGWRDRFAAPEFGERQRDYARLGGVRTVYTPGFVVNGREWRAWFRRPTLSVDRSEQVGSLRVSVEGEEAQALFEPADSPAGPLELHVALLGFDLSTEVRAGENRGRTLEHDFVVLGYARVPLARSEEGYRGGFRLPAAKVPCERKGLAVWVSTRGDPRPLQAAGGWLD
ncbi:MAG: DUF1223 domain-containing protein [Gammaproteobacteria bacterium]|nr:DUF1223 domain-containing protein [Gammaproteobacteria bacterium]